MPRNIIVRLPRLALPGMQYRAAYPGDCRPVGLLSQSGQVIAEPYWSGREYAPNTNNAWNFNTNNGNQNANNKNNEWYAWAVRAGE